MTVPVGISKTSASASFFIVTSFVLPWPVRIKPSALVYPIAALSPAAVSPSGSKVVAVATLLKSAVVATIPALNVALPAADASKVRADITLPPSFTLINKSLSATSEPR